MSTDADQPAVQEDVIQTMAFGINSLNRQQLVEILDYLRPKAELAIRLLCRLPEFPEYLFNCSMLPFIGYDRDSETRGASYAGRERRVKVCTANHGRDRCTRWCCAALWSCTVPPWRRASSESLSFCKKQRAARAKGCKRKSVIAQTQDSGLVLVCRDFDVL